MNARHFPLAKRELKEVCKPPSIPNTIGNSNGIIAAVTTRSVISAMNGANKGIKILSNINLVPVFGVMLIMFAMIRACLKGLCKEKVMHQSPISVKLSVTLLKKPYVV